jgi:signal transduction histidine kinase
MNLPQGYNTKLYQVLDEANNLKFSEPQKALEMVNFVYVQALKSSDDKLEASSLYMLGLCNELLSNYPQAMKFLSEAIKLANSIGEVKITADALNCVGIIHDNLNNYSKSLKSYFRALKIYEELSLNKNIGIILSNIGLIYTNINDYKNALKYYSQALDIAEELDDEESLLITNINIGLTHKLLGNYSEGMKFLNDAIKISTRKNDLRRNALAMDLIADIKAILGDIKGARDNYTHSLKIKTELSDKKGIATTLSIIGQLDLDENNLAEARKNISESLKIFEELRIKKSIYQCYHILSKISEKENDINSAYEYYKKAHEKELEYLNEEAEVKAKNISTQLEIEQAQKEAEIQRLKNIELAKALEDVKQLNVSLNDLNEEKNEFMAIAVHDLKNPLQNILSTARVIKRSKGLSESELDEFTTNIVSQTDRMFNLIKKLLDHNAIEQGNIKIKNSSFSINELCAELVNNFKDEAKRKGLNIVCEDSPANSILYLDKDILYEILQNLLSNAIKFSPPGKNVYLRTYTEKNDLNIEIADEGPGFTEKDKGKIFTKFTRLSAKPTGDEHSTGLGLSIVKRLCEIIGANLTFESEEGKGAKFTVSIKIPQ